MGRALSTIPWTVATVTALSAIRSMLATGMALENPQEGVRDTILWMPPVDAHAATLEYCYPTRRWSETCFASVLPSVEFIYINHYGDSSYA